MRMMLKRVSETKAMSAVKTLPGIKTKVMNDMSVTYFEYNKMSNLRIKENMPWIPAIQLISAIKR